MVVFKWDYPKLRPNLCINVIEHSKICYARINSFTMMAPSEKTGRCQMKGL